MAGQTLKKRGGANIAAACHEQLLRCAGSQRRLLSPAPLIHRLAGELGYKMAEQRFLWSVLPCLMAWPTVAMPVPHAAGLQVGVQHRWCMDGQKMRPGYPAWLAGVPLLFLQSSVQVGSSGIGASLAMRAI